MIKVTTKGLSEFQAHIKTLPRGTRVAAMRAVAEYLLGNSSRGLKHEPSWKFVSRAKAYGKVSDAPAGYFSWKQFRKVAAITEGFTKTQPRTHEIVNAWKLRDSNDWRRVALTNNAPGAQWVIGEKQARQPQLVGWRAWPKTLTDNMKGALRAGQQAVNRMLKEKR